MITNDSIGLDERLARPEAQGVIQPVNRALEHAYGGGFDLSAVGMPAAGGCVHPRSHPGGAEVLGEMAQ